MSLPESANWVCFHYCQINSIYQFRLFFTSALGSALCDLLVERCLQTPGPFIVKCCFPWILLQGVLLGTISVIGYLSYAGVLSDQLFPPYVRARLFPCHQLIDHSLRPSSCIQNRSSRLHFVFSSFFLAQKNSIAHQARRFWNSLFGRH